MKRLLILIAVACFFILPALALAGNTAPKLYLELWQYADVPDPIPGDVCVHTSPVPPAGIHCYDAKTTYWSAIVALHVGNLNQPVCTTTGVACVGLGGYLGVPFGVNATGEAITFMSWNACPGFLKGPSSAGEPAACLASSTKLCHDWQDHLGYLVYINLSTRTGTTFLDIMNNADLGYYWVVNCHNQYDFGTTIGGRAQWGGAQSVTCATTPVAATSWGNIKSLFR